MLWIKEHLSPQFVIVFLIVAGVAVIGTIYYPDNTGWLRSYCTALDRHCACSLDAKRHVTDCATGKNFVEHLGDKEQERLFKVVEKRLDSYRGEIGDLRTNLWLQMAFMAVAFAILMKTTDEPIKIPVIDREVDVKWARLIIPLILLYLYVVFGFLFDHLIQERYILWTQLEQLENGRSGYSIHSLRMLLEDRWVMDSWFSEFHSDAIALPNLSPNGNRFLLAAFGGVIALQHSCALLLLTRRAVAGGPRVAAAAFLGVSTVYGLSHVGFLLMGQNPNWVHWFVGGGVLVILFLVRRTGGAPRWTMEEVLRRKR